MQSSKKRPIWPARPGAATSPFLPKSGKGGSARTTMSELGGRPARGNSTRMSAAESCLIPRGTEPAGN
eukprot:1708234-Heterocapsa_arctica.AAC.1